MIPRSGLGFFFSGASRSFFPTPLSCSDGLARDPFRSLLFVVTHFSNDFPLPVIFAFSPRQSYSSNGRTARYPSQFCIFVGRSLPPSTCSWPSAGFTEVGPLVEFALVFFRIARAG